MSQRKKTRKGQIRFTGLRFFLQEMKGRVSRQELVEFIRRFFSSRGLEFDVLEVKFRMTRRPSVIVDGKICPVRGKQFSGLHRVEIYLGAINNTMTPARIMETIAHELDHEAWELGGKKFDHSLPYSLRPHEIQARGTGRKWRGRFQRQVFVRVGLGLRG